MKRKVCAIAAVVATTLGLYGINDEGVSVKKPDSHVKLSVKGNTLRFTKEGLMLIGNAEGCRRDPYRCPAGIWTVGIGSTGAVLNRDYTIKEIAYRYANDTMDAQNCIEENVEVYRRLPSSVFNAFGSFIFNTGCSRFRTYRVFPMLVQGKYRQACDTLLIYDKANHRVLPGLQHRRQEERQLCVRDLED